MQDPQIAHLVLSELRGLGVGIALDDFGTGHASLRYLANFPVTGLKIDRAFVSVLSTDRTAGAVVRSVMALADSLELHVVAEGIESERQLELVRDAGCMYAQGYFLSEPLAAEDTPARFGSAPVARII